MSFNNSGGLLTINFGDNNPTLKFSLSNYSDYSGGTLESGDKFKDVLQLHGSGDSSTFTASINLADVYAASIPTDGKFSGATIGADNIVKLIPDA